MSAVPLATFKPDTSKCWAFYSNGKIKVSLTGEIPGAEFVPWIVRDVWAGGIHLSLAAHWGGLGEKPPYAVTVPEYEGDIVLPTGHGFQDKYVLIQTADDTFQVQINYTGVNPPTNADADPNDTSRPVGSVLPPTTIYLPGGGEAAATAPMPAEGFTVILQYRKEFLRIWDTRINDKTITWILKWEKFPEHPEHPEYFTVNNVFTGPIGVVSPSTQIQTGTSHTFFVKAVLLGNPSASDTSTA